MQPTFESVFEQLNELEITLYCSWVRLFNESAELAMQGKYQQSEDLYPAMWRIENAFESKGIDTMTLFY